MYTKKSLLADLKAAGINPRGTLHVHSSVKSVGECENGADTILDALIEYMRDGLLTLPTHTWDYVTGGKKNIFDHSNMPSCVGVLTNLFMKREGVVRSLHPTHSVAAIGKDATAFIAGEELSKTPCPRDGCYGKLYDRDAQILFLGCPLSKNTYIHGVEEWNTIPNRLTKKQQSLFIKYGDELIPCPQYRHHFAGGDISENYVRAEPIFVERGAAVYCKIGDSHSVLCSAIKMADITSEVLQNEPDFFA
ncbi:MAG: AAC(3) family N-acetyltransferase [Defluviitaleaceae bacterium]|nr:AAC(3) family N-acetyltransferase [Defluviitaleaceae bacterium]